MPLVTADSVLLAAQKKKQNKKKDKITGDDISQGYETLMEWH
jgi:hypothetical protein